MATILAAVLENGTWVKKEIEKGYKALQKIVGGLIQIVPLPDEGVTLYVNEEGKVLGLPVTGVWIDPRDGEWLDQLAGPMVALGPGDEDGYGTPITDEALAILNCHVIPVVHLEKVVVYI